MSDENEKERLRRVEQEEITAGQRIKDFMEDPIISGLLLMIEKEYAAEFLVADTEEKRLNVWGKTHGLVQFTKDLRGVFERGHFAQLQRSTREAAERRTRRANPRNS